MRTLGRWTNLYEMVLMAPEGAEGAAPGGGGDAGAGGSSVAPDSGGAAPADGGGSDGGVSGPDSSPAGVAEGHTDWNQLGSAQDLDFVELPAEQVKEPPAAQPPVEAPKPAPVQEAPAQPTPQAQSGPEGTAGPRLSAADPMGIAAGLEANRDVVLAHLAETKFALTDQDIQELETDVVSAVPRIMSRVFFESQVSMQKFLAQAVPGMVKQFQTVTKANDDAERMFFSAHKGLDVNNPSHRAAAVRIASVYRQANPNIPLQQLIAEVGPMVSAALKLNGGMRPPAAQTPRGGTPFRPAVGGSGASPNTEPVNEWAGLGRNYDDG